jgi:hypothetical protein
MGNEPRLESGFGRTRLTGGEISGRARTSEMAGARNDFSDIWRIGTDAGKFQGCEGRA